jgi:acetyl/propionyl-CoA carboxylase alpha subunit
MVRIETLLVANRGEIAVRIMRTAHDLGMVTVAVHPADDASALHVELADKAVLVAGEGAAAYLDGQAIVQAALKSEATAIHPGYGFLAEDADFAEAVEAAGLIFVGPTPATLRLLGDKVAARDRAASCGVPVLAATSGGVDLDAAQRFMTELGPNAAVMVKALAGGGGRGIRPVTKLADLPTAMDRCASESLASFGTPELYLERRLSGARHIEVQCVGDGWDIRLLGDRDCSIQRARQKVVEIAPAPGIHPETRDRLADYSLTMAKSLEHRSLATFEFLVLDADQAEAEILFLEANARIQVEHTVTEQIYGVDLVAVQLRLAAGETVSQLDLPTSSTGVSIQARVCAETINSDGQANPSSGTITAFQPSTGPGVRVDTHVRVGDAINPRYDSLLAKLIVHSQQRETAAALRKLSRALREFRLDGPRTTLDLLTAISERLEQGTADLHTEWFDQLLPTLLAPDSPSLQSTGLVLSPVQGTVKSLAISPGQEVARGQQLAIIEAMKMEQVLSAPVAGTVESIAVTEGQTLIEGQEVISIRPGEVRVDELKVDTTADLDLVRPDLAETLNRHEIGLDARRTSAVEKRHAKGRRTARENLDDLIDPGTYIEYGAMAVAAQRRRRKIDDLIANTPADGMIAGIGRVNGSAVGSEESRCVVMSYDYTVLAGTQGLQNHRKKDRLFDLAAQWRLPVVIFAEGGGGRPGDTDGVSVAGLDCLAFGLLGDLSGLVPLVGIASGYCFAGNAALLGTCDVVIATEDANIGMGGPAMIEGGGLGVYHPKEIGPIAVQSKNGVVDLVADDDAHAVSLTKKYLSYFQGATAEWDYADQRLLRSAIPEDRLRVYDVRSVVTTLADSDSVLELRREFGIGIVTALARIEGRPVGIIANNPTHLAGAIDPDGADKACRFMQLCDAFDLPIVQLCDTPGFMVGPEIEEAAMVRKAGRMFVTARSLTVPTCTIVLRKGYGLGAQAMASGGFKFPMFTVAWPTGEFGGMGLEGAVRLGYRKELEAIEDPQERRRTYEAMVTRMYEIGKADSMADHFEIDDVIDPSDSRRWIAAAFESTPSPPQRTTKKRPMVDTW